MSSVASASMTSATSSSVMIPTRWSSSSTTGIASRFRSVRIRAAVSWSAEARTRTVDGAISFSTGVSSGLSSRRYSERTPRRWRSSSTT